MKNVIIPLLLIISGGFGQAQDKTGNDTLTISGVIWDAETIQPLPYAHVYTPGDGTFTNLKGEYRIRIGKNDTLKVSYIGYESQKAVISGKSEYNFFWLKPFTTTLNDVVISPFPSEDEMKEILLQTETQYSSQKIKANQNLLKIQNMYLKGYRPRMNSLDNYLNYMKGPQGVNILSTNPTRGVSSVLRNIRRK